MTSLDIDLSPGRSNLTKKVFERVFKVDKNRKKENKGNDSKDTWKRYKVYN